MQTMLADRTPTIEQIATTIEKMKPEDQRRLLDLTPSLLRLVQGSHVRTLKEAQAGVDLLKKRLAANGNKGHHSANDPFIGGLTWSQYGALNEQDKEKLWAQYEEFDEEDVKKRDVNPDTLSA